MIYSCNLSIAKKYSYNENCIFIGLVKKPIDNFYNYHQLTPDNISYYGHENNIIDWDDYKARYISNIDKEFLSKFIKRIFNYVNSDKILFIVTREYYYKFSYRRIFNEYIKEMYNINIEELKGSDQVDNISDKLRFNF